jgi:hypothetical protein
MVVATLENGELRLRMVRAVMDELRAKVQGNRTSKDAQ